MRKSRYKGRERERYQNAAQFWIMVVLRIEPGTSEPQACKAVAEPSCCLPSPTRPVWVGSLLSVSADCRKSYDRSFWSLRVPPSPFLAVTSLSCRLSPEPLSPPRHSAFGTCPVLSEDWDWSWIYWFFQTHLWFLEVGSESRLHVAGGSPSASPPAIFLTGATRVLLSWCSSWSWACPELCPFFNSLPLCFSAFPFPAYSTL